MGSFFQGHKRDLAFVIIVVVCTNFLSGSLAWALDMRQCLRRSAEIIAGNQFNFERSLADYKSELGKGFAKRLSALGPDQIWVDFGAGIARPQLEYLREGSSAKAQTLAIAYKYPGNLDTLRRKIQQEELNLRYLEGQWIEKMELQPFDLGTDVFGPFSYSNEMDEVLKKYLDAMKPDGSLFIDFLNYFADGSDFSSVVTSTGERISVAEWIGRIPGLKVEFINVDDYSFTVVIRKSGEPIRIPRLAVVNFLPGIPPRRWFREIP